MALIKCPECDKQISDKAHSCPNCGCPMSANMVEVTNNYGAKKYIYVGTIGTLSSVVWLFIGGAIVDDFSNHFVITGLVFFVSLIIFIIGRIKSPA